MNFILNSIIISLLAVSVVTSYVPCQSPRFQASSYTTNNGILVKEIAFITEIVLSCKNAHTPLSLHALVKSQLLPIAVISNSSSNQHLYQVSWTEQVAQTSTTYDIDIYEEDGYLALLNSLKMNEDISHESIKPLVSIVMSHNGIYKGPWVNTELVAVACYFAICYFAITSRMKIAK